MRLPAFILGYHGCDKQVAERILAGKAEITLSKNPYDWLGTGAYFWENNPARALSWAESLASRPKAKITKPAVIGAIIDPGNCLDLTEKSSMELVKQAYAGFELLIQKEGSPMPENKARNEDDHDLLMRYFDCAVFNSMHKFRAAKNHQKFDTVRAPFLEGKPLYKGTKLVDQCHIQWCVRDPKNSIIAYFRPRDPEATEV